MCKESNVYFVILVANFVYVIAYNGPQKPYQGGINKIVSSSHIDDLVIGQQCIALCVCAWYFSIVSFLM